MSIFRARDFRKKSEIRIKCTSYQHTREKDNHSKRRHPAKRGCLLSPWVLMCVQVHHVMGNHSSDRSHDIYWRCDASWHFIAHQKTFDSTPPTGPSDAYPPPIRLLGEGSLWYLEYGLANCLCGGASRLSDNGGSGRRLSAVQQQIAQVKPRIDGYPPLNGRQQSWQTTVKKINSEQLSAVQPRIVKTKEKKKAQQSTIIHCSTADKKGDNGQQATVIRRPTADSKGTGKNW